MQFYLKKREETCFFRPVKYLVFTTLFLPWMNLANAESCMASFFSDVQEQEIYYMDFNPKIIGSNPVLAINIFAIFHCLLFPSQNFVVCLNMLKLRFEQERKPTQLSCANIYCSVYVYEVSWLLVDFLE